MKTLDHKVVEIIENLAIGCVEKVYLDGRKAHRCQHIVDGVLPRAIQTKAAIKLTISVKGEVGHEMEMSLSPSIYACADCLLGFLSDKLQPRPDLAANHSK